MPKEVAITVYWDLDRQVRVFRLKTDGKRGWRIVQRGNVPLMIIQEKDSDLHHEIPLENVLYWTVDTSVTTSGDSSSDFDRFCSTCKVYFSSSHYREHPYPDHDVRRICCGTSPQHDHQPSCPRRDATGEQRLGKIFDISDDNYGNIRRFSRTEPEPDPDQPGIG